MLKWVRLFGLVLVLSACDGAVGNRVLWPRTPLERELAAYQRNPSNRQEFEAEVLKAQVLVRVDDDTIARLNSGSENKSISFYKFKFRGRDTVPIYTSAVRLGQVVKASPYVILSGREALLLTEGFDVCVNCGLVPAVVLYKKDVERILGRQDGPPVAA